MTLRKIEPCVHKPGKTGRNADLVTVASGVAVIELAIGESKRRRIALLDRRGATELAIALLEALQEMETKSPAR